MHIKPSFFKNNRKNLIDRLNLEKDEIVIVPGSVKMQYHADQEAEFLQESNFFYLTGINEPGCMLVIDSYAECLVIPESDDFESLWNGQVTASHAKDMGGFEKVIEQKSSWKYLQTELTNKKLVYTLEPPNDYLYGNIFANPARSNLQKNLSRDFPKITIKTINHELAAMRLLKQPDEIMAIETAINVTADAFLNLKQRLKKGVSENNIYGSILDTFASAGYDEAYKSIIAGGERSCTIHYVANNQQIQPGEMVLIDAGARVAGYAADITRTFSVGSLTTRQQQVMDAVCEVHDFAINLIKPGLNFVEYEKQVVGAMAKQLKSLKLIKNESDIHAVRKYFPHATSHFLGLDVHDVGFHKDLEFAPNMILTVEPGIYIPEEQIGIRLENDVLVTKTGYSNLSSVIPLQI